MIKKLFIILLCFNLTSCGGFSFRTGLKFDKSVNARTDRGNPSRTGDTLKLNNEKWGVFYRPMGECGTGVVFFVFVVLPVPVWFHTNMCEKELIIETSFNDIMNLQLKYNDKVHDAVEKKVTYVETVLFRPTGNKTEYKFKIDNFWKFKFAKDKALIITSKDGLVQELPVKWGIVWYNDWSII